MSEHPPPSEEDGLGDEESLDESELQAEWDPEDPSLRDGQTGTLGRQPGPSMSELASGFLARRLT